MDGPLLTEERLRHRLDANQVMRERLCLALLPILGPYTQEQPRRPKGGPDGARDIEAVHQGSTVVWGAVGFRNGGGNDATARRDAQDKFHSDLSSALKENPDLKGFVFFTNVDLTPSIIQELKAAAIGRGLTVVDVYDIERLRHALDSSEGLIARLQYLEIPMTTTEQLALVGKFGAQLQQAVTARFDRVERTLSDMRRFLDFQKPLHRFDVHVLLKRPCTSADIGDEAVLLILEGLLDVAHKTYCLCVNRDVETPPSSANLVSKPYLWLGDNSEKVVTSPLSVSKPGQILSTWNEITLSRPLGHRLTIAELTSIRLTAHITSGLRELVDRIIIDINGYELFNYPTSVSDNELVLTIPDQIPFKAESRRWHIAATGLRNMFFDPPQPSNRHVPLTRTP